MGEGKWEMVVDGGVKGYELNMYKHGQDCLDGISIRRNELKVNNNGYCDTQHKDFTIILH